VETVSRRISDVLHVPEVSVLLRGDDGFQLCHSSSRMPGSKLGLAEQSTAVRRVVETNRPAMVYQKSAEGWLLQAEPQERHMLEQLQAEVLLPLPGRQRLMGVMVLGRKKSEEPYSVSDLRVLQSVGVQTGLALEVSELAHSLAQEASQRARMNREMEIARDVQQRFFPRQMPVIAGLDLAGACRPALGVGGDYYDVIELGDGRVGLAIGDVSGKGISAALLMAGLRACLRTLTLLIESANSNEKPQRTNLARLMQDMNRLVYEASEVNRYATFFFGIYDCPARTLHYVNAGHNAPMLLKASGIGSPVRLETGGSVIGLLPHVPYSEAVLTFEKGDLLLTYTDGISEAMTADDEEWGEERMFLTAERLRHSAAADVLRGLFAAADEFTGTAPQYDDMTLLVLKVN
jgi:sigma-B regulation protein RsbU (phosphoserine phosphatase)